MDQINRFVIIISFFFFFFLFFFFFVFIGMSTEKILRSIAGLEISNEGMSEHWVGEKTGDVWIGRFS